MSLIHTRPTVGSKRCGYDQRALGKDPLRYSSLCTHKAKPSALASALVQCENLLAFSPFAEDCPFRGVLQIEVAKGEEGLLRHYKTEAKALLFLERYHNLAKEASKEEQKKRVKEKKEEERNKRKEEKREVERQERRAPLKHNPFKGIV